jgi:hypothetical protein
MLAATATAAAAAAAVAVTTVVELGYRLNTRGG